MKVPLSSLVVLDYITVNAAALAQSFGASGRVQKKLSITLTSKTAVEDFIFKLLVVKLNQTFYWPS